MPILNLIPNLEINQTTKATQNATNSRFNETINDKLFYKKGMKTPSNSRLLLGASLALGFLLTASCSTVSVSEKNSSRTIVQQRDNIVTKNALSNKTSSVLVSFGVPSDECFTDFDACLKKVEQGIINKNSRESLALYAELYLAKAKQIEQSESCVHKILRPPIDPYYANAPLSPEDKADRVRYLRLCNTEYRDNLLNAVKYSYAYLFYPQLHPNAHDSSEVFIKPNYLPTDLDIQTIDVYDAATDALIKQLYSNKDHSQQVDKITSFIDSSTVSHAKSSMQNGLDYANGEKYGDQIKVLNFTFPPISEDPYFSELIKPEDNNNIDNNAKSDDDDRRLSPSTTNPDTTSIDLYLPNEPEYLQNTQEYNQTIDKIYASHDLSFSGLNSVVEREGFGISYVTLLDERLNTSVKGLLTAKDKKLNSENPIDRIHLTGNLLITGVLIPKGETLKEVLDSNDYDIRLYNPHHTKTIDILNQPYFLAANFSSSYGLWLAENHLSNVGYFNLLAKQQTLTLPQLFMLEPYDPNKRIIIMLHGLASSPAAWVSVTNDISNDTELRENYQVWQIFYPTNIPILENRYRIQELIETAYKINDPDSKHIASHHSVLIGHSMGAVIARLLVSNQNLEDNFNQLTERESNRELSKLLDKQFNQYKVKNRLHLQQLDSVDTAVFISAPFRGTDFADRWFTRLLRRIVQLPIGFAQTIRGNLTSIATEGELVSNPLGALYFENGASQLSDKSSFMKLTADLDIADNVTYHSIIANRDSDLYQGLLKLKITSAPDTALSSTKQIETSDTNTALTINSSQNNKNNENGELNETMPADNTLNAEKSRKSDSTLDSNLEITQAESLTEDITEAVTPSISDGIVPYGSSHLEGAASETVISGGHGIQESPEAILTLRKILHQHLKDHPTDN